MIRFSLVAAILLATPFAFGEDYKPGAFFNYSYEAKNVPKDCYQYSIFVPKDYDADKAYPLVFYLHGGGKGRTHPNQGKYNMVSARLSDNDRTTDAGYSKNDRDFFGYILVSPVKPVARWDAKTLNRTVAHVKSKVNVDSDRVYVTGFSMGGQGTWIAANGMDDSFHIAAMMPLGAWGCNEVRRGDTAATCKTIDTPVWVLHCPLDNVSKIGEQLRLFQNHLDCGGYGRFTMIPGRGHISRPRNDREFFNMRMGWMLSQEYGTPFNYALRVQGGSIARVQSGERPYTCSDNQHGFYEAGTTIKLSAPESNGGKKFVKWASDGGEFEDASSRQTSYTTTAGDATVMAVYGDDSVVLTVEGGSAEPAKPSPGDVVTISLDPDRKRFSYWAIEGAYLHVPSSRNVKFVMPSNEVKVIATATP